MDNVETWKSIVGYEGIYEVSDQGRVKSLLRKRSDGRRVNQRILKQTTDKYGYKRVGLCRDGSIKSVPVHRLVAIAFLGGSADGFQVCHNNGDPADNLKTNLRWDTCKANHADKKLHGRTIEGEKNGRCKYPESTIRRIFELRRQGVKYKQISAETGVSWMYAWNIVHGQSWKHLQAEAI